MGWKQYSQAEYSEETSSVRVHFLTGQRKRITVEVLEDEYEVRDEGGFVYIDAKNSRSNERWVAIYAKKMGTSHPNALKAAQDECDRLNKLAAGE